VRAEIELQFNFSRQMAPRALFAGCLAVAMLPALKEGESNSDRGQLDSECNVAIGRRNQGHVAAKTF
jgi:hypothetical protein